MENNYNSVIKEKSNKLWIWFVLLLLVVLAGFFIFKQYKKTRAINTIPSYFTESLKGKVEVIPAVKTEWMKMTENEKLEQDVIIYTENKTQNEVLQDFYQKIMENKWTAVDGSTQEGDRSVFKIVDENKQMLFIMLEGGIKESLTTVRIYKVIKNN